MTPETSKLIKLLESELGYSEGDGAYTKFGDWYGKTVEFDADYSGAPWCDMFLSWAAHKLGYEEWVGQFAYTVAHAEWFKEKDAWGTKPKPGALVFYDWSGSNKIDNIDHVGIVTKVEGDTIFTIEGNIDGGVAKRKERDQSKVVGYGYPDKIKKRLEAAKLKEAEVDGSLPPDTGPNEVDRLQLPPQSETTGVTALIPRRETSPAPSVSAAGEHATAPRVSPSASARSADTPAATAGQTRPGKKGKHAKPATADTEAVTREPVTAFTDASATTQVPNLGSPAIIGPVLLAALGLLAVARTRQLRVRPAASRRPAAGPSADRRLDTRPELQPDRRTGRRRAAGTRRRGTGSVPPVEPLFTPATTTPDVSPVAAATTPFVPFETAESAPFAAPGLAAASSVATTGFDALPGSARSDLDAAAALAAGLETSNAILAELESSATTPFDAFGTAADDILSTDLNLFGGGPNPFRNDDDILNTDLNLFGSGPNPFRNDDDILNTDLNLFGSGPNPFRNDSLESAPASGTGHDVLEAWEGSAFAAAHENRSLDGYRGRRRSREHPADETTTFRPDAPARGRRHRASETVRAHRATSTGAPATTFSPDAPLGGRRHRPAAPARSAAQPAPARSIVPHAPAGLQPATSRAVIQPTPVPESWETLWEAVGRETAEREPVLAGAGASPERDTAGRTARGRKGRHRA
ncbi:CHAP domain-containing protein [Nonomuraea sp. bgisy101]|uniref:CHAP domain-containing protein n=1 Tax=Nonomuraea sp. bgisy101 TaxID=3413784 RepID=UPI003D705E57